VPEHWKRWQQTKGIVRKPATALEFGAGSARYEKNDNAASRQGSGQSSGGNRGGAPASPPAFILPGASATSGGGGASADAYGVVIENTSSVNGRGRGRGRGRGGRGGRGRGAPGAAPQGQARRGDSAGGRGRAAPTPPVSVLPEPASPEFEEPSDMYEVLTLAMKKASRREQLGI